jgi:hypothetical protein
VPVVTIIVSWIPVKVAISLHMWGVVVVGLWGVPVMRWSSSAVSVWVVWIVVPGMVIRVMPIWRIVPIRVVPAGRLVMSLPMTRRRTTVAVRSTIMVRVWITRVVPIIVWIPVIGIILPIRWSVAFLMGLFPVLIVIVST